MENSGALYRNTGNQMGKCINRRASKIVTNKNDKWYINLVYASRWDEDTQKRFILFLKKKIITGSIVKSYI
jgi:hypothetical protein